MKPKLRISFTNYSITEFLANHTNLDLKEAIPKALSNVFSNDKKKIVEKLTLEEKEEKKKYITVEIDDYKVIDFLAHIVTKNASSVCRVLFETEIYHEHREWILANYIKNICPDEEIRISDFNDVLDLLAKKEKYNTTVGTLLQLCNQKKKTESFVIKKFSEIKSFGGEIVYFNGNKVSEEEFKNLDNDTRIIIRPKEKEEYYDISEPAKA